MANKASLISIASYLPEKIMANKEFESFLDTSDEWIIRRTGIKYRRVANESEQSSDLGFIAGMRALKRANLEPKDIDALIVATLSPDNFTMPSTASIIAAKMGIKVTAFDISAACTGFIYMLELARALVESGVKQNVLIIGAEKISSILDYQDRSICVLFGDGAGAGVVSLRQENHILDTYTNTDGKYGDLLITKRAPNAATKQAISMSMRGNEVFKIAVTTLVKDVRLILERNQILAKDIKLFIPHQANLRIIKAVQEKLGLSDAQCQVNVHEFGNTSAASIPMALNSAYEAGKISNGDLLLLDAFGGGFTSGSALLRANFAS